MAVDSHVYGYTRLRTHVYTLLLVGCCRSAFGWCVWFTHGLQLDFRVIDCLRLRFVPHAHTLVAHGCVDLRTRSFTRLFYVCGLVGYVQLRLVRCVCFPRARPRYATLHSYAPRLQLRFAFVVRAFYHVYVAQLRCTFTRFYYVAHYYTHVLITVTLRCRDYWFDFYVTVYVPVGCLVGLLRFV